MSAEDLIERLSLAPHPEGGHFRETWRDQPSLTESRGHGTAIYYLLRQGERSHWHRVDATEIWHFYMGDPLELSIEGAEPAVLGPHIDAEQRPQLIVPAGAWQSARTLGAFTLVGCTVSPAFDFDGFELAPPGWEPEN
jgi:predicted cupin superfamily sugar epimerase